MPDDSAHWVDLALDAARRQPLLDHLEVRADVQTDRRWVRRLGDLRVASRKRLGGIAVRAFVGRGTGFAHTNEPAPAAIGTAVDRATELAVANDRSERHGFPLAPPEARRASYRARVRGHPDQAETEDVYALMARAEDALRAECADAKPQVSFGYKAGEQVLADSAGTWIEQATLHSTLLVQTVVRDAGRLGDGNAWLGGERGIGDYEDQGGPEGLGTAAAKQAQESTRARAVPSGRYRVLSDNHLTGIMVHESFGHLNEYDLVASGWSVLRGRRGERLAADGVTIRDVPMMDGPEGVKVPFDQEGTPGRELTILEDGVLKNYMHTRGSATEEDDGVASGNARALNAGFAPLVRMRNTYMEPGDLAIDEALELLGDGLYLIGGRGGSPRADGSFMFAAQRGYIVEKGVPTIPIRMASIYGNVLDLLGRIEGRTKERRVFTTYFGGCGKWDQSFLHIGNGGPHVIVSDALVGSQGGADTATSAGGMA